MSQVPARTVEPADIFPYRRWLRVTMMQDVRNVLTDPRLFFAREVEDPSVRKPAVVIGTLAVVGALSGAVIVREIGAAFPAEATGLLFAIQVFAASVALVAPFVVWLLYAVVFFGASALLGGEGSFRNVVLLTAWGFVPRVIEVAAEFAATLVAVRTTPAPDTFSAEAMETFSTQLSTHPAAVAASLLGIVLLFWSAYIWVAALRESRRLDRREAILAVAVPVAISLLLRAYGLLGGFA